MFESKSLFCDYHEMGQSGQRYKQLTRFSRFVLFKRVVSTMQRLNLSAASIFVTEGCLYTFISCYLKKIIKIGF